jgi:dipeptidyl aminopeptidase/acylaminoacyl peptidase
MPGGRVRPFVSLLSTVLLVLGMASAAADPGDTPTGEPAGSAPDATDQGAPPVPVRVEGPLRFEDIPPVDPQLVDALRRYQALRSASFQGFVGGPAGGVLVRTRFDDVAQIHHVAAPGGARTQLTFGAEPVRGVAPHPTDPDRVAFLRDEGGNEAYQVWILDRSTGEEIRLTDGIHRHGSVAWTPDGSHLAWSGTARNGTDYDIYLAPADAPRQAERIHEGEGLWWVADLSPGARILTLGRYRSITDSEVWRLDRDTGQATELTPGEGVAAQGGLLLPDGDVLLTSDHEGAFRGLYRARPDGALTALTPDLTWDVEDLALSPDGRTVALRVNERGWSRLYLLDLKTGRLRAAEGLPEGMVASIAFDPTSSRRLGLTLYGPTRVADAWTLDVRRGRATRWTESETGGLDPDTFRAPTLETWTTFDDRELDAFVYRPAGEGPHPVVVWIHGGPESQSRPYLSGMVQVLLRRGVAVVFPNVRGSAGYGKDFVALDDGRRREDSVKDIGTLLDWIGEQPDLDGDRVAVKGGSYGGYMVLASLAHFGDRLQGGIDVVGISSFVTFLENTKAYRRDLRRAEYGDERDPEMRSFLEEISPLNQVERIRSRLFVIHGANDPRVPVGEAEQIVAAVRESGHRVWYLRAENEGHGFRKKDNRDVADALQVSFLLDVLGVTSSGEGDGGAG